MKKWISILLCLIMIASLTGCGDEGSSSKPAGGQPAGVEDVLEAGMEEADSTEDEAQAPEDATNGQDDERQSGINEDAPLPEEENDPAQDLSSEEGIDVDLTTLSSTMVYSEVYNMMSTPDDYIGKTVKMSGAYASLYEESTDKYYFACIVQDATACCSQGIEFVPTDDYKFPDDYPEEGDEITVVGVFETYQEGENTYCTLKDANFLE